MSHQKAVIYCRVSELGHDLGLETQEEQCRQYAEEKGYEVVRVFQDKSHSMEIENRPGLNAMFQYMNDNKSEPFIVIIYDISRFSQSMVKHIEVREMITKADGKLESPSFEFKDDPENRLFEQILAAKEQFLAEIEANVEQETH